MPFYRIQRITLVPHFHLSFWMALLLATCPIARAADSYGIVYPEMREPYNQVFLNIKEGVNSVFGRTLHELVIDKNTDPQEIYRWIEKHKISGVIALSSRAYKLISPDGVRIPVVAGAGVFDPSTQPFSGITLDPSPLKLFEDAKAFNPNLTEIFVVYERNAGQWMLNQAKSHAQKLGITLTLIAIDNIPEAATSYRDIQNKLNNKTQAIWLPIGSPARDKSILQSILEKAWEKDQVIISSNLSDVKRGALLALFPDNVELGKMLAHLLLNQSNGDAKGVQFLNALQKAINLRTAEHLGKRYSREELEAFNYVYPPQ